jgi:1-acyl-sn-glycerol-3-phosphate acyltransferase
MSSLSDIKNHLSQLEKDVETFLQDKTVCNCNIRRRKLYSAVEMLRIELEAVNDKDTESIDQVTATMNQLIQKLRLVPVKRQDSWFTPIEICLRFLGVCGAFIFFGTFVSLPILMVRVVDLAMNADPFNYMSEKMKHFVTSTMLFLSGIEVEVQGLKKEYFASSCALLTFTHASNLDGFLVAGTCPTRQLAFGKKELFVVPFFSWISLAIGGVPVDRGNRDRAVQALQRSVESAKKAKVSIAIAPEGTRSTTGQLLPFKKGRSF